MLYHIAELDRNLTQCVVVQTHRITRIMLFASTWRLSKIFEVTRAHRQLIPAKMNRQGTFIGQEHFLLVLADTIRTYYVSLKVTIRRTRATRCERR